MLRADILHDSLSEQGVTHLVGLPDNSSAALISRVRRERHPVWIPVTREGEAPAISSGLWMGGARPAVVIQNTGLLESGDSLRGTAVRMRVPLVCLVTFRGDPGLLGNRTPISPDRLSDPDCDSAGLLTIPTLRAWGIPWIVVEEDGDQDAHRADALLRRSVQRVFEKAATESHPAVLLLVGRLRGQS